MARTVVASWLSLFLLAASAFAADAADTTSDPTVAARMGDHADYGTGDVTVTPVGPMATALLQGYDGGRATTG